MVRRHRTFLSFVVGCFTLLSGAWIALSLFEQKAHLHAQTTGYALRFYGSGVRAPGLDRVLIPIDAPERPEIGRASCRERV